MKIDIWQGVPALLSFLPYALLYIIAFEKSLRVTKKSAMCIAAGFAVLRMFFNAAAPLTSETVVEIYNYVDFLAVVAISLGAVRISRIWQVLFVALMLKNTADAAVVFAKFAEHLVNPTWADMGYNWSYSVSLLIVDLVMFPIIQRIIRKYFTPEINGSMSDATQKLLWLVPGFFYLTWIFIFYYSSPLSDLEQACLPLTSLFLFCSICCQNFIYVGSSRKVRLSKKET